MATPNIPDYPGGQPWYLSSVNHALYLDEASGNVVLRTGFQGNIIITGNVNIPGTVTVNSSPADPVHTHVSEVGTSGILTTPYMPVGGNVNAAVSGTVSIQDGGNSITVDGNVGIIGNIAGITALPPITGNVNAAVTGTVGVSGNVNIGTMPPITGNVTVVDGGNSITVDGNVGIIGNVNIGTMPNVNANITGGNVTVQQGTTPWVITGNTVTSIGGTNLDAFGRLRVSNPTTLFDSRNLYVDGEQFSALTSGAGARNYVQAESSFNLSVGTNSGDSVVVQSKTTQAYQPGKSLLTLNTFAMAAAQPNLRQRVGYFTDKNGVYFEQSGLDLIMVVRSSASGSLVEERVPQSNWNGDRLDGTGPSGIVLDPTMTQIVWSDIEWLGVGTVRTGFVIDGQFILCHSFHHANQPGNTRVYMTTATLNPRYEITNVGPTSGATMKQICSTVISEGGYSPSIKLGYVTNGTSVTRVGSSNTLISLCSIRLNPAFPDAVVIPSQLDLLLVDVRYGEFRLVENATIPSAAWSNVAGSVVQSSIHADTITDGNVIYSGITSSRDSLGVSEDIAKRLQLWRHANGTPSTLTLAVAYTSTNADLLWKFGWQEL